MRRFKKIKKGIEARDALIKGADFLGDCVRSTLGPNGQNFAIEKGNKVTNDGVTVAREIELKDEIEHRGVCLLKEAAIKTNDIVGDGTTTAIVLAQAITREAVRSLGKEGVVGKKTPAEILKQIERERTEITEKLVSMATEIKTEEELINSAIVSVEDRELGKLIGEAQWKIGKEGVLIAEEVNERECSVEYVTGLRLDNGFGTSSVINNQEKQSLDVENASVILTNFTFDNLLGIKPLLEQLNKTGVRDILLFGRAFSSNAVLSCMENIKNGFRIFPINAPYVDQAEVMKDLAAVLGGTFYHQEERELSDIQISDLGFAEKFIGKRYDAVIAGKADEKSQERISNRLKELEDKSAGSGSQFEKKGLRERIAQLKNGFAIIKIGAVSETERKYKKDKADDAVNAVRVALQEGTVPGAGLAFKTISESLSSDYILKKPLLSIYEQIVSSSPKDFVIEDWVRDPVKVLRVALENAASVAGTLATAGGAIAWENERDKIVVEQSANETEN